ncbi:hypothetical protein J2Y45_004593 [Dyadobacter sp. BE34]|uniref:Uncharacterized protein n=1 Tax=Dyadobacter fermentans TaxID=94254 RepID=A0ABU1R0Y7_9BACT|nr:MULTISPECIES: hypothetical protein [Dyadobacter]MDR6807073.1 hypothetical protein [Dyadobacter fermentans]MDR7044814.1 hypothetical protein [Dyadobacter sp. BE242]MDR7199450.1 hypothetical protein [Dyadobacter sp. BE34]MDR7217410.1 hypothetical protein [Dyadobacter sp. BE31]MDR7265342.1 hypothetical protein [Dyadobacter sp. BE32]
MVFVCQTPLRWQDNTGEAKARMHLKVRYLLIFSQIKLSVSKRSRKQPGCPLC